MHKFQLGSGPACSGDLFLDDFKVPEFSGFICGASYEGFSVRVDLERPNGAIMSLERLQHYGGGNVEEFDFACFGTNDELLCGLDAA